VLFVNADGTINAARTVNVTAQALPGEILVIDPDPSAVTLGVLS